MKKILLMACLFGIAHLSGAVEITINASVSGNVDWNSAIWGSPVAMPTNGNDYVHDDSTTAILLGMGVTYGSFAGDKLTLDSGTQLYNKGGGALGGALYLNGGQWQSRSAGTAELLGNIRVTADSTILLVDGSMQLSTGLSSSTSNAVLVIQNHNNSGKSMVLNALDSGFTGTFSIKDSGLNPNTWEIRFDKSYPDATLKVEGQQNNAAYAAIYQLTNDIAFANVLMPNGSGGLVDLDPGTYDAAALTTAGVSSTYFNDLGGTIVVGASPEIPGIVINSATTGSVGWNTAIWGDPAAVPVSGTNYIHDSSASAILLGMGGTYVSFIGDKLTLDSGATLYNKGGGALGGALYLNGGQWQTRSPGTAVILGNIRVTANSTVLLVDGNMQWNSGLSSTNNVTLTIQNHNNSGKSMVVNALDSGFTGTFSIKDSGLNPNTWDIQFDKSYSNATLKIEGQKNDASYAAIYQLTNSITFANVLMPNGAGGLVTLGVGIYNATALTDAGVSSTYFNDLGGTIIVGVPVPSYATWAADWGVDIGSESNNYDGDLLDNLAEYGLGGDPTNALDIGLVPTFENDEGTMVYIHAQRTDDSSLSYYLETRENLVFGTWTNAGYSVVSTNVTGGLFDFVTNTIPTLVNETFVRLMIETP